MWSIQTRKYYLAIKRNAVSKESTCNVRDHLQSRRLSFDLWVGKITWKRKWQYTLVEREAWQATVHPVSESVVTVTKPPPLINTTTRMNIKKYHAK